MIPAFDQRGLLPAGVHEATDWTEVERRFAFNAHRQALLMQMRTFIRDELSMVAAGLEFCIGGSYVSDKAMPSDIDCTIAIPVSEIPSRGPLFQLSAQGGKGRIWTQYKVELYPTLVNARAHDFRAYFEYVGPKTALEKGLADREKRGIVRVTQWHLG